jgi:hypothetical protein
MQNGVDMLGSYVMSALTATIMGGSMSVIDVHGRIAENGWGDPPAADVKAKLDAMVAAGSLRLVDGDRYAMSAATISSLFKD